MRAALLTGWRQPLKITDLPSPEEPGNGADPDVASHHVPGFEHFGGMIAVGARLERRRPVGRVNAPFILACRERGDWARGHRPICADQVVPGFSQAGAIAEGIAVPYANIAIAALGGAATAVPAVPSLRKLDRNPRKRVDPTPLIERRVSLSSVSAELAAFGHPARRESPSLWISPIREHRHACSRYRISRIELRPRSGRGVPRRRNGCFHGLAQGQRTAAGH